MRLPITPANTLWRALRDDMRGMLPGGRVIVAVDGDAAGARIVADGLAAVLGEDGVAAFQAHADDFHLPRAQRIGDDVYDWSLMRRVLLDPFRDAAHTSATTGFQLSAFDTRRDRPVMARWVTAPADAVLLVDGDVLDSFMVDDVWDWRLHAGPTDRDDIDVAVDVTDPDHPARIGTES